MDSEHILHGQEVFMIKGLLDQQGEEDEILCTFQRGKGKTLKRNKKAYKRLADHVGRYPVVMITPYDANLILDGSEVRRRSLDALIAQFDKIYLEDLMRYNKALAQRNRMLKHFKLQGGYNEATLEAWDEQLIRYGGPISETRSQFMGDLTPIMNRYYQELGHESEEIGLEYRSQLKDAELGELLKASRDSDRAAGHTTVGIHKDDLLFTIGGRPLKRHGSQGQQKTYLLALKLAHFELIRQRSLKTPLLLLDDIFDKIDPQRMRKLLNTVSGNRFGQIIITDTDPARLEEALSDLPVEVRTFKLDHKAISSETQDL